MPETDPSNLNPLNERKIAASDVSLPRRFISGHCLVLAILTFLLAIQITPKFKLDPDGIGYMSLARNLAQHGKWEHLGSAHVHYAPGYSLIISPAFWIADRPFVGIQLIHLLLCFVLMLAIHRWFSRYDVGGAIFVTAFVMVNVGLWDLFRQPSAEMAFMPLVMLAAVLLVEVIDAESPAKFWVATIGAAVTVMAACLVRQNGVFVACGFAAAIIGTAVRNKRSKGANGTRTRPRMVAASAMVVIGAVVVAAALLVIDNRQAGRDAESSSTYTSFLHQPGLGFTGQIIEGLRRQTAEIGRLIIPGMWKTYARAGEWLQINTIVFLAACVPIALGWWKLSRQRLDPLLLTFPFYFGFCVYYPLDSGARFTVPMLPVLAACLWRSMEFMGANRKSFFFLLVVAHLIVSIGFWIPDRRRVNHWYLAESKMRRVAAALPRDRRGLAGIDLATEDFLFLALFADRRTMPLDASDVVPASVEVFVTPNGDPETAGFEPFSTVDDLKIERRFSPAQR